jgi:iron complex outermembrane recepter protein
MMAILGKSLRLRALNGSAIIGLALTAAIPGQAIAQDSAGEAAGNTGLAEIVVTAQRRLENQQDVPIAVSAVTSDALESGGVNTTNAITQLVPSVQFTRSGTSGLFFVRGVGTTNASGGEEGANAFYVDGVYIADLAQTISNFNNIERIEVLKGPQGTLFGRNATGGLVHIITRDPGDELTVKAKAGFANYDTFSGQFYAGGPLTEQIGMDIAFTGMKQGKGWGRNITRNEETRLGHYWGVRGKLVFKPSDALKITLAGDHNESFDNNAISWRLEDGTIGSAGQVGPGGQNSAHNDPAFSDQQNEGVSLTVQGDLGFATLTSISAFRNSKIYSEIDVDAGALPLIRIAPRSGTKSYQQEVRLSSNDTDPFAWQVGGIYLRVTNTIEQLQRGLAFAALGLQGQDIAGKVTTDSYAGFAEGTYAITPTTHLTAGVRYTKENREINATNTAILLDGTRLAPGVPPTPKLSYSEWTYRFSLRQDITDDINVYASVNRGFKAGLYTLQSPTNPPVAPQFIMAYEVGLKSELFDRRLRLNLAGFHYDIDNLQIRSAAGTLGSAVLLNAAQVKVNGFEAEFEAAPTETLRLFGGFTILDSKYKQFGGPNAATQAPIVYQSPATCPAALRGTANPGVLGAGPRTGGTTTCFGDVSGLRTALAPKFAATLGATLTVPLQGESEIRATAVYNYNSGYVFEPDNVFRQPSFSLLNMSLEYRINQNFAVEVWANNLTDEAYFAQKITSATGTASTLAAPRTYGLNAKLHF